MPRFEIKVKRRPIIGSPTFSGEQMQEIGAFAVEVMKERTARATDVFDQPAKPLQDKYAKRKIKKGLAPVRDIHLTGKTLAAVQILEVDETHVRVGIKGSDEFRKALFNQNIDPWFGLSDHDDERVLREKVAPLFSQNIADATK